jgi:hypothetical protein
MYENSESQRETPPEGLPGELPGDSDQTESEEQADHVPRNAVVGAKENLYSRVHISVRQINTLIIACVALVILLVLIGVWMN